MSNAYAGLAKVGKDRWLWCVWNGGYDSICRKEDLTADGYEVTEAEARAKIRIAAGETCFPLSNLAREWHRVLLSVTNAEGSAISNTLD